MNYNDSRLHSINSRLHYTHFPSHLFNKSSNLASTPSETPTWDTMRFNACQSEPGKGLRFPFSQKLNDSPQEK